MSERFNGTWKIDLDASTVWDDATQSYAIDEVGEEIITISGDGKLQDYEVLYGDDPEVRMGYTARFDDPEWTPYIVRGIKSAVSDEAAQLARFKQRLKATQGERERHFEIGRPYGLVRLAYVDELTHYRISKNPETGKAQVIMQRRMADDGNSYMATLLDVNGIVYRKRRFVRV